MSNPPLGEEFLDIPITQREAQLEPNCVLDDHRRKVMAAIGDFSHRATLPSASLPGYPVKTDRAFAAPSSEPSIVDRRNRPSLDDSVPRHSKLWSRAAAPLPAALHENSQFLVKA